MTIGKIAFNTISLLPNQSGNIYPSSVSQELVIHNIIIPFGYACELYQSNGSVDIHIMTITTSILNHNLHCNVSHYYKIKNISGTTINVAYNGIITSE